MIVTTQEQCSQSVIKMLSEKRKVVAAQRLFGLFVTPIRRRDLHPKQFCLDDIAPAVLIILITHIIATVRWMLIKILSAVIKRRGESKVIVSGGLAAL